jgi:hypothetical protein
MTCRLSALMALTLGLTIASMALPANAETCHAPGDPKCSITCSGNCFAQVVRVRKGREIVMECQKMCPPKNRGR